MASTTETRNHGGHSHGHHDNENEFLTSSNKKDAGVRITRIGLYVNLGMAIGKGIGGYYFNSKALTADAIHSLTDLVSDVMTLATVSLALKPPSEKFPSGYGKVESLGSLGVSGILLAGGFFMGWTAILTLCQQFIPGFAELADTLGLMSNGHGHNHGHSDLGPNINAAWLAGGSIAIKEWLYRASKLPGVVLACLIVASRLRPFNCDFFINLFTALKVAKERKSSVLASNAYHHRVDSLTAFVALLMIGGSNILNNASWMDPVGGLVISLMVVQAGWGNTRSAILELADKGVDQDIKSKVRKATYVALDEEFSGKAGNVDVRQIQGQKAGQSYLMDVELGVPEDWNVTQTRRLEDLVRNTVGAKVRGVKRVKVRFVPRDGEAPDFTDEFIRADVTPQSSIGSTPEPELEEKAGHPHSR